MDITFYLSIFVTILTSGYVTATTMTEEAEKRFFETYSDDPTAYINSSTSTANKMTACETALNKFTTLMAMEKFVVTKAENVDQGTYNVKFTEKSPLPIPTSFLKCTAFPTASSSTQKTSQDFFLSPQLEDGNTFMLKEAKTGGDAGNSATTNNELKIIGLVSNNAIDDLTLMKSA